MTQEEIKKLAATVNRPSEDWKKAFDEYNAENSPRLRMGCPPCYLKVLRFLQKKYNLDLPEKIPANLTYKPFSQKNQMLPIKKTKLFWRG